MGKLSCRVACKFVDNTNLDQQINSSNDSHYGIPFGGYKQSGIGRELGSYALSAYSQVKAVHGKL